MDDVDIKKLHTGFCVDMKFKEEKKHLETKGLTHLVPPINLFHY